MIESLYEPFKHWSEMSGVFILSDTHFNDSDCKLMDKNWISVDEQVDRINKLVHKNDTLIILGDVGDTRYISRLKAGYKVLVMGNHDTGRSNFERKIITKRFSKDMYTREDALNKMKEDYPDCKYSVSEEYDFHSPFESWVISADNKLFDEVYEGPLMIGEKIFLSHEPILGIDWCLNIHGHDHSGKKIDNYHLNLASNVCNYTPLSLGEYIKTHGLNKIKSLHRDTIDTATFKKAKKVAKKKT